MYIYSFNYTLNRENIYLKHYYQGCKHFPLIQTKYLIKCLINKLQRTRT